MTRIPQADEPRLRERLNAALDAIEGQVRGFKTLQYRQGWLDAIQSLRAEVSLPDDMAGWSAATGEPPDPLDPHRLDAAMATVMPSWSPTHRWQMAQRLAEALATPTTGTDS